MRLGGSDNAIHANNRHARGDALGNDRSAADSGSIAHSDVTQDGGTRSNAAAAADGGVALLGGRWLSGGPQRHPVKHVDLRTRGGEGATRWRAQGRVCCKSRGMLRRLAA